MDNNKLKTFLETVCNKFKIVNFTCTEEGKYSASIACELRKLGSRKADSEDFVRKFARYTSTQWIAVRQISSKLEYKRTFICRLWRISKRRLRSKQNYCNTRIEFKSEKASVISDASALGTSILININHVHRGNTDHKSLKCTIKNIFYSYFERGLSPKEATSRFLSKRSGNQTKKWDPSVHQQIGHMYERWKCMSKSHCKDTLKTFETIKTQDKMEADAELLEYRDGFRHSFYKYFENRMSVNESTCQLIRDHVNLKRSEYDEKQYRRQAEYAHDRWNLALNNTLTKRDLKMLDSLFKKGLSIKQATISLLKQKDITEWDQELYRLVNYTHDSWLSTSQGCVNLNTSNTHAVERKSENNSRVLRSHNSRACKNVSTQQQKKQSGKNRKSKKRADAYRERSSHSSDGTIDDSLLERLSQGNYIDDLLAKSSIVVEGDLESESDTDSSSEYENDYELYTDYLDALRRRRMKGARVYYLTRSVYMEVDDEFTVPPDVLNYYLNTGAERYFPNPYGPSTTVWPLHL